MSFFEKRSDAKINVRVSPLFFLGLLLRFTYRYSSTNDTANFRIPPRCRAGGHDKRRTTNGRSVRAGTCRRTSAAGDRVTVGTRCRSGRQYGGEGGGGPYAATRHRRRFLSVGSVASRSPIVQRCFSSSSLSRFLDRRRRSFFRFNLSPFPRWAEALRYGRKR